MRLLLIGGSGLVGSLIIPRLAETHQVVVYDLVAPAGPERVEFRSGSVEDFDSLVAAMEDIDVVVYLAMNPKRDWGSVATAARGFDLNVKGPYLAWRAAAAAGVRHGVHASTLSVWDPDRSSYPDETVPTDATDFYGFTKSLGEQVCRNAVTVHGLTINSLRLCHPTPDAEWPPPGEDTRSLISTSGSDVAAAVEAALHHRDGYQAFVISGDSDERVTTMAKAAARLGWRPTART